jgi:hypothetical protein
VCSVPLGREVLVLWKDYLLSPNTVDVVHRLDDGWMKLSLWSALRDPQETRTIQ